MTPDAPGGPAAAGGEPLAKDDPRALLWSLLDHIDTLSDAIKPTDEAGYRCFYERALSYAAQRHDVLRSDGYRLFEPREPEHWPLCTGDGCTYQCEPGHVCNKCGTYNEPEQPQCELCRGDGYVDDYEHDEDGVPCITACPNGCVPAYPDVDGQPVRSEQPQPAEGDELPVLSWYDRAYITRVVETLGEVGNQEWKAILGRVLERDEATARLLREKDARILEVSREHDELLVRLGQEERRTFEANERTNKAVVQAQDTQGTLDAVMWLAVDKWLDDENGTPEDRASRAREVALQANEKAEAENAALRDIAKRAVCFASHCEFCDGVKLKGRKIAGAWLREARAALEGESDA